MSCSVDSSDNYYHFHLYKEYNCFKLSEYVDLVCALVNIRDYLLETVQTLLLNKSNKKRKESARSEDNSSKQEEFNSGSSTKDSPRSDSSSSDMQQYYNQQYRGHSQTLALSSQPGSISLLLRNHLYPIKTLSKDPVRIFIIL